MNSILKKITSIIGVFAFATCIFGTVVCAATPDITDTVQCFDESQQVQGNGKVLLDRGVIKLSSVASYWPGDHDLGGFTFTNRNTGNPRTYHANQMQIKPAWKPADNTSSEIDLYIRVYRNWNNPVFSYRFTMNDDVDGKDGEGWWYAESRWFDISKGEQYYIYYEAFTNPNYKGTGAYRRAHVHTWIELRN